MKLLAIPHKHGGITVLTYEPKPKDLSKIEMPEDLLDLLELIAEDVHDTWAKQRISEGWQYGSERDDNNKFHPDLVPYKELEGSEKQYDRLTAIRTIKFILASGYSIVRNENTTTDLDTDYDLPF